MAQMRRLAFLHILCSPLLDVKQEAVPSGGLLPGSQPRGFKSCHCPGEPGKARPQLKQACLASPVSEAP